MGLPRWILIVVSAAAAGWAPGCAQRTCSRSTDCDDADLCTEDRCELGVCSHLSIPWCCHQGRACVESCRSHCDAASNRCVECLTDADCAELAGVLQICQDIDCEPCRGKSVFWEEEAPRCHPEWKQCVACLEDTDCPGADLPRCHPQKAACVGCIEDSDCGPAEHCSPQTSSCERVPMVPGAPCTGDAQCQSGWCLGEEEAGYPGGFCGVPCGSPAECVAGACVDVPGGKTCLPACAGDEDCRAAYMCLPVDAVHAACFPKCSRAADCPAVGSCDPWLGLCGTPAPGGENGAPCGTDADCKGVCATEEASGAPAGVCVSGCSAGRTSCPRAGEICAYTWSPFLGGLTACLPVFDGQAGCRDQYVPLVAFDLTHQSANAVCQPSCRTGGCQAGACNPATGLCGDPPRQGGAAGAPCATHTDCAGLCMDFWPEGYCTSPCDPAAPDCGPNEVCMDLGIHTSCGAACESDQDCRTDLGYICLPGVRACVMP